MQRPKELAVVLLTRECCDIGELVNSGECSAAEIDGASHWMMLKYVAPERTSMYLTVVFVHIRV
jgi:hypothetical protein